MANFVYYDGMGIESAPKPPLSSEIPESNEPEEQAFLDDALTRVAPERRPEFLGYLRKYEIPVEEGSAFLDAFLDGQTETYLEQRKSGGAASKRKAA